MRKLQSSLRWMLLMSSVIAAWGCFITNCPPGGKRSEASRTKELRECKSCGPRGARGRCYGSNICCFDKFGCLIGTPETYSCGQEARSKTLCRNSGAPCSGSGNGNLGTIIGQCAADGVCCSSETCTVDENCQQNTSENLSRSSIGKSSQLSTIEDGIGQSSITNEASRTLTFHALSREPRGWHHYFNPPVYDTLLVHDQGQGQPRDDSNAISTSQITGPLQ